MDILQSFKDEVAASDQSLSSSSSASAALTEVTRRDVPIPQGGTLLICGCIDWDAGVGAKGDLECLDNPTRVPFDSPVIRSFSSSSSWHLFVLLEDGRLYSFGRGSNGQLGLGTSESTSYPTLVKVEGLPSSARIVKVATGSKHSLLLASNGDLYVCGGNNCGQLGLGDGAVFGKDQLTFIKNDKLSNVRDIACGADFSMACTYEGRLYTWGHPEYGQLGNGTTGQFIQKAGSYSYSYVTKPYLIDKFIQKDPGGAGHLKRITEIPSSTVRIRCVAAGKNHCIAVEDWETPTGETISTPNRTFSWGNGAHGKLGHNSADDEMTPREITTLCDPRSPQKAIRVIECGGGHTLAIAKNRNLFFWGKMSNSPRGEATTYPKLEPELLSVTIRCVAGGSNSILVGAEKFCAAWGVLPAGKFGLVGDVKSSTKASYVASLEYLTTLSVSCGYGHCCYIVTNDPERDPVETEHWKIAAQANVQAVKGKDPATFAAYPYEVGGGDGSGGGGKKRTAPAAGSGAKKSKK